MYDEREPVLPISCTSVGNIILISWEKFKGANGYRLFRKRENGEFLGVCDSKKCYIRIMDPKPNESEYKVKPYFEDAHEREYLAAGIPQSVVFEPSGEMELNVDALLDKFILTWTPIKNCDGYRLYRKNGAGEFFGVMNSLTTSMTLPQDKFYADTVKVTAYKNVGNERIKIISTREVMLTAASKI